MEDAGKEVPVQVKPERKSIFARAADRAKAFVSNLNPIGKDKAWFAGLITGTAESLLLSPLIPLPAAEWVKAGVNSLIAHGVSGIVNKFYDIKEGIIRSGISSEVQGRIIENAEKRAKASTRIKNFFGGVAAGTIVGFGVTVADASTTPDIGADVGINVDPPQLPDVSGAGPILSDAGEVIKDVASTTADAAQSAAETSHEFVKDSVMPVVSEIPGYAGDGASTGADWAGQGAEALVSGTKAVAEATVDAAGSAYDKTGELIESSKGPAESGFNTVKDTLQSAGETTKDFVTDTAAPAAKDAASFTADQVGNAADIASENLKNPDFRTGAAVGLGAGAATMIVADKGPKK